MNRIVTEALGLVLRSFLHDGPTVPIARLCAMKRRASGLPPDTRGALTRSSAKMRSSTSGTLQVSPAVFAHPKWKKEAKKRHMGHSILVGVPHIGFKEEV